MNKITGPSRTNMSCKNFGRSAVIRNEDNGTKVAFINDVISQIGIPAFFKPLPNSNGNKIFYRMTNNGQEQREWLLFENNVFFCVYCLCFSSLKKHRLIEGIEYVRNCRVTETLNSHEFEAHHNRAKAVFLDMISGCETNQSENRMVVKSIVKIIIFLATHGEFLLLCNANQSYSKSKFLQSGLYNCNQNIGDFMIWHKNCKNTGTTTNIHENIYDLFHEKRGF